MHTGIVILISKSELLSKIYWPVQMIGISILTLLQVNI